ncbi:thioesterase superfamily protein [Trypanosoma grayi]|uniref:thioesterase superfamily protein n=1 Tax=Trypanosoma grayi TaxID=71804 RepID=UPI0004F4B59B|nr:thioesterase superfamily protein [Trypanosoma grayi]KEG08797.1 thioesterase superfamily protein [Trypanosoma grayi]
MLSRQSLWVPVAAHSPAFLEHYITFTQRSPHTNLMLKALKYAPENTRVLLQPDSRNKGRNVTLAMAFPFTITSAACEACGAGPAATRAMGSGAFTSLVDTASSLHLMERLLPSDVVHVSVNIQANCLKPISEGERVVLISRMDKAGKRLNFLSAELLRDDSSGSAPGALVDEKEASSVKELERLLRQYTVLGNGKHVKCVIQSN